MMRQAVFLVGGLGTRLKERTRSVPKPLLEINGRPFIEWLMDEVSRHGFTDILLLAGHLGDMVRQRYDGHLWRGARVRVLQEPRPLGTGGALRFAHPHLAETFLLANGDSFFDINLRVLAQPRNAVAGGVTMALRSDAPGRRYGWVHVGEGGLVRSFHAPHEGGGGPINAGIYCMSRSIVDAIPEDQAVSLEGVIFPELARKGLIRGVPFEGYFVDIGVPDDFERADRELTRHLCRPAIFLDRDGVLNVNHGYVHSPDAFDWIEGARAAVRACNDRGMLVFVVTNQAGVAHGYYDEASVEALHGWINERLAEDGAHVDAFEYCPHHAEGKVEAYRRDCRRRKPGPGMIEDLLARWNVDASRSLLVGDSDSDVAAAQAAGIAGRLFTGGDLAAFVADAAFEREVPG